jgi:paraquat-inducible protein B
MATAGRRVLSGPPEEPELDEAVPAARVRRRRWLPTIIVWLVPIVAAVVAGYLVYGRLQEFGPEITLKFADVTGVRPGQTEIRHRGVPVGRVDTIALGPDAKHALVTARVRREATSVAREGSVFWIVRPEVRFGGVSGLGTIVSGPYIEVRPGSGAARSEFTGLDREPLSQRPGLRVVLAGSRLGPVRAEGPVSYRGIVVGTVTGVDLSRDSTVANVEVVIFRPYARLVRVGSRFWTLGDVEASLSLFKGLQIDLDSPRTLVTGGIAFATPENPNLPPARDGMTFVLHDKPEDDWLRWAPKITLPASD